MSRQPVVRILNMDTILPEWQQYLAGFYKEPTSEGSDVLILGIELKYFYSGDAELKLLKYYDRFIDSGKVHLFVRLSHYNDVSGEFDPVTKTRNGEDRSKLDQCLKRMMELDTELPYTCTVLAPNYSKYAQICMFASLLQAWGCKRDPIKGPSYRPDFEIGQSALAHGWSHVVLKNL